MTITFELPPEQERKLLELARASGREVADYVLDVIRQHLDLKVDAIPEDLIDHEVVAECEADADESITLEAVRAATSKIKGSMAQAVIEERSERF